MTQQRQQAGEYGQYSLCQQKYSTGFFFALLSLGRYGVNLGFIERPLFAGLIWGAASGDMALAVSLAIFYELFWLDLFPAGTYMPPNALFPMICVLTLSLALPAPDITGLFLLVIMTLPLASLGSYLEKRQRDWQVAGYNKLILTFRAGGNLEAAAGRSIYASLALLFTLNSGVFFAVTTLAAFAVSLLASWQTSPLICASASWPLLWSIGAVGGLLSLRIRRNYIVFAVSSLGIFLFFLLAQPSI